MRFGTFSSFVVLISQIYLSAATAIVSLRQVETASKCTRINTAAHAPDTWDYVVQLKKSDIAQTIKGEMDLNDGVKLTQELLLIFQQCEGNPSLSDKEIQVTCQGDNCIIVTVIPSRCPPAVLENKLRSEILTRGIRQSFECSTSNMCIKTALYRKLGDASEAPIWNTTPDSYRIEQLGGGTVWQIRVYDMHFIIEDVAKRICEDIWDELDGTTQCRPFPPPFPRECKWNYRPETAHEAFLGDALVLRAVMPDKCDKEAHQQEMKKSIEKVTARHGMTVNIDCGELPNQRPMQDTDDLWLRPFGEQIKGVESFLQQKAKVRGD